MTVIKGKKSSKQDDFFLSQILLKICDCFIIKVIGQKWSMRECEKWILTE